MVAAPLVALAFRPGRLSLVAQVAGVGICVAISAVAAIAWRQLLSAACLVLTAAVLYALSRTPRRTSGGDESAHPKSAPHWPLLIVACVAIPPSILAAIDLVVGFWQLHPPTDDDTWSIDHWPMQAALALAIPTVAVLASFRAAGWRDIAAGRVTEHATGRVRREARQNGLSERRSLCGCYAGRRRRVRSPPWWPRAHARARAAGVAQDRRACPTVPRACRR
jgi:hypothetical protein